MTTPGRKQQLEVGKEATDRRLRLQIAVFSVVFAVVTGLVVFRVIRDGLNPLGPLVGFAAGLVVGIILARSKPVSWNASEYEVVSSMSVFGIIVTLVYFGVRLLPNDLVSRFAADPNMVTVIGLAVTGGVMLGRTVFTLRSIRRLLASEGVLTDPHA